MPGQSASNKHNHRQIWAQLAAALFALVEPLAGIGGHSFHFDVFALWSGQRVDSMEISIRIE